MALGGHFGPLGADFGLPDCVGYFSFLGALLRAFGDSFGASLLGAFWGSFWASWGALLASGASGAHFGAPGGHFGASSGRGPGGGGKGAKKAENGSKCIKNMLFEPFWAPGKTPKLEPQHDFRRRKTLFPCIWLRFRRTKVLRTP